MPLELVKPATWEDGSPLPPPPDVPTSFDATIFEEGYPGPSQQSSDNHGEHARFCPQTVEERHEVMEQIKTAAAEAHSLLSAWSEIRPIGQGDEELETKIDHTIQNMNDANNTMDPTLRWPTIIAPVA